MREDITARRGILNIMGVGDNETVQLINDLGVQLGCDFAEV